MARFPLAAAVSLLLAGACATGDEKTLFDFEGGFDPASVEAQDADAARFPAARGAALRVLGRAGGGSPAVTLKGPWDLSAHGFVAADIANIGKGEITVSLRVDSEGSDGKNDCCAGSLTLAAGARGTLKVPMERRLPIQGEVKLFGMRGYPGWRAGTVDPSRIAKLVVFAGKSAEGKSFEIDHVRAGGEAPALGDRPMDAQAFFPFIDVYGQYVHRDWPGKTRSAEDLAARKEAEAADLARRPGPGSWNRYGGWKDGPALEATGVFRVQKHEGKWWLVDPEGRLFFSHGIDCVRPTGGTPVEDREAWFAGLPEQDDPRFKEFFYKAGRAVLRDHYKGRQPLCYNFTGANLLRKYGAEWKRESAEITHRRLRSWGLNTIANWSDSSIYLQKKTPYVATINSGRKPIEGSSGYWGPFPDPFDPDFREKTRARMAQERDLTAGDPWCVGYFVDNELAWGNDVSLAAAALKSPPGQKAKQAFVEDLKAKYAAIDRLNAAWKTSHASWEALLESREAPDINAARGDLAAFYGRIAEQYFKVCREAVKEAAPRSLYLGCRFAWVNDTAARAAARHCDVVSYNIYKSVAAGFAFPGGADVPLIIGEFHFGALDRGMFHPGLVKARDQKERARMYQDYVQGVLRHPQFVGCHWFQYRDQCTTGRELDGENDQIGVVDIVDSPYPETIEACREVGYTLYEYRLKGK